MPIAKSQKSEKKIRYDIQALRAFAVASVVLYHLWPGRLEGGFTGVDIFFVISGYLMTISIMGRLKPLAESGSISTKSITNLLVEFYARRIKRLVPAALVTLLAVLGLATATNNLTVIVDNTKGVISAATFWQNWYLADQSVDYLHSADDPLATQHFWSLSLEEQFYLMWPLVLIVSTLITLSIVILYKKQKISGTILPITLLTIASLAYGYWLTKEEPSIAYFSTPARVWELMIGGIIAFLPAIRNYDLKLLLPHVGLAMCFYSVFFIPSDGFPGWHALIPTIGTALIILAGTDRAESRLAFDNLSRWKPIQWIGNISYSIYLWHWPLIILLPVILQMDIDSGRKGMILKFLIILLTLVIAHLSYRFIEEPARKVTIKTRYIYLIFVLATCAVAGGAFGLKHYGEEQIRIRLDAMHQAAMDSSNICFGAQAILNKDKCKNSYGNIDTSNISVGQQDVYSNIIHNGFERCQNINKNLAFSADTNQDKFCTFGDLSASRHITLFGDSHMQHYLNTFHAIGLRNNYKIYLFDVTGCFGKDFIYRSPACTARYEAIRNSKQIFENSSLIVMSFLYRSYDYVKKNIEILKKITQKNFAFLQDNAYFSSKTLQKCYMSLKNCAVSISSSTKRIDLVLDKLIKNKDIRKDQIVNTREYFCNHQHCYMSIGGVPVYFNTTSAYPKPAINTHLTASYSLSLAIPVENKLRDLGFLR